MGFELNVGSGRATVRKRISKWWMCAIGIVAAAVVALCIGAYGSYMESRIYEESSKHLLTTYEQVGQTFELLCQRNWNILDSWGDTLGGNPDEAVAEFTSDARSHKNTWNYSDAYLFNEDCQYVTAAGRSGTASSIDGVFKEMYEAKSQVVSSYIASSGQRKVVFAVPLQTPFSYDGVTYTGVALSYDNTEVAELVTSNVFDGESDCYVVRSSGDVVLSLQPKSEFTEFIGNIFTYLKKEESFSRSSLASMKDDIKSGRSGSALCESAGQEDYLVYRPVGSDGWSIVGVVRSDAVDRGMLDVRNVTVLMLLALCIVIGALAIGIVVRTEHRRLQRKEAERREIVHQKELSDQLFQGMATIVDRIAVVDLVAGTYEYREHVLDDPLYPAKGAYTDLLEAVSARYVVLTDSGDAKLSRLLDADRLRRMLEPGDDPLKFEYAGRNEDVYKVMNIVPLEWDAEGKLARAMFISQDIGQKVELANMANTDGLTGLFNERYFSARLAVKEKTGERFALFYLDLDRFKPVNDTYGHDMGDKLLKAVAARLLESTRPCDLAFRIGGDEFALIATSAMDERACAALAERIDRAMSKPFEIDGAVITVGASCGWARHPEDGTASEVRVTADQRMYDSKRRHHSER